MKNKMIMIPIIIVVITLIIGLFLFQTRESEDNRQFKSDYGIAVPKGTEMVYLNDNNLKSALESKDKLVFLGQTSSSNTKKAVKVLLQTAEDNGIDKIYYYDLKNISNKVEIAKIIKDKTDKEDIIIPTLFLLKNKTVYNIEEGYKDNIEERYEDILIDYTMCTTPEC